MILIDTAAEKNLIHAFNALRVEPDATGCIHAKFSQDSDFVMVFEQEREKVLALVQKHLTVTEPHVYLCEDGDLFVLSTEMPLREAHMLMLEIADLFGKPVEDHFIELTEVNRHINRLMLIVQHKLDSKRYAEEAAQRALAMQQMQRKREAILNGPKHASLRDIALRRHARESAELMVIEDDSFSRRLVENVLGTQYGVTSLDSADEAIATYARLAPDLLFLDINLPNVTGHELLARIMALDPHAHVVMISSNADEDNISRAMRIGAKGFVAKPFTREKLIKYIKRCPTIPQETPLNPHA